MSNLGTEAPTISDGERLHNYLLTTHGTTYGAGLGQLALLASVAKAAASALNDPNAWLRIGAIYAHDAARGPSA